MGKLKTFLSNLPECMVAILTISIALVVFFELCIREVFGYSVFGITGELTRILIVWLSMIGAAVGVKRGSHFVFPILAQRLGPATLPYLSIFSNLTILGFATVLIISGFSVSLISAQESFVSLPVSVFWENLAVPVSGVLILPYCFLRMGEQIRSKGKMEPVLGPPKH